MYYVLLYYPRFDRKTGEDIEAFRRKYDPFSDFWKPHIPFIFPVPCNEIEEEKLVEHVETVLKSWKPWKASTSLMEAAKLSCQCEAAFSMPNSLMKETEDMK